MASDMNIRPLEKGEEAPMNLLLLADPSEYNVHSYLERGQVSVAEVASEIIGVYVLLPQDTRTIEIMNVAINEAWQGAGRGKQLVTHAVETARQMNYQQVTVATGNSSIGQLALYQKCGFRMIGVNRDYFLYTYSEPIFENDIWCRDQILLAQDL